VLRFVSGDFIGPFLPNYEAVQSTKHCFGLQRIDHCVGNTDNLFEVTDYIMKMTGAKNLHCLQWRCPLLTEAHGACS
jgi:4-hydroxyphenylpyruvate dioxygenase